MATMTRKRFDAPDETRSVEKAKIEIVDVGGAQAMRATFEPGWRWSECMKPVVGTESCQVAHLVYVVSGRMVTRMDDGSETEIGPGDVANIPPGHDAWIVGDEPFVGLDFQGAANYAKPHQ
jgi:hypothetical protein